jgi:deazaflavin-dependent oxidoreductase (nitroreductase family)
LALALNATALLRAHRSDEKEGIAVKGWIPGISRLLARVGWVPIVTIRGRRSGQLRRVPLAPLDHDGARYLVAVQGEADWARNLAAAGTGELLGRGRRQPFSAVEVDGDERIAAAIAYQRAFGRWMKGLGPPPPPDRQRVFRITPEQAARAA